MKRFAANLIVIASLPLPLMAQDGAATNFPAMSFDELLSCAQVYATTDVKKANKQRAREEIFARKVEALDYLMAHIHTENMSVYMLADELLGKLPSTEAAPVLLRYATSPHDQTRKLAAFFLGLYEIPEYTDDVLPLLRDAKAAGAAVRTLGKWKVREAVPLIITVLEQGEERRRVAAANALRDIGDKRAAPHLIAALNDPCFTVRKAAARALAAMGRRVEGDVLAALPESVDPMRRELIGVLGAIKSQRAVPPLHRCLNDSDPLLREEATLALQQISLPSR